MMKSVKRGADCGRIHKAKSESVRFVGKGKG